MRPLRYSINITLDGCCHHEAGVNPDEESMRYWTAEMERADALLFGRVTHEMMESAWRQPATGTWPDWMDEWAIPFAETIDRAKKYVVSNTLSGVDWNAELLRGDLGEAVQKLKQEPGEGLSVGGVTLPLALADMGLFDEFEFVVQPVLAGHGPTLLAGLRERIELELVDRREFRSEGLSPSDTGPRKLRLDVTCPGTMGGRTLRSPTAGSFGPLAMRRVRRRTCPVTCIPKYPTATVTDHRLGGAISEHCSGAAMRRGVTAGDRITERAFCAARDGSSPRAIGRIWAAEMHNAAHVLIGTPRTSRDGRSNTCKALRGSAT